MSRPPPAPRTPRDKADNGCNVENIRVLARIRPPNSFNITPTKTTVTTEDQQTLKLQRAPHELPHVFALDKVFSPESSQQDVFQDVTEHVESVLKGVHVAVLAYGQTGTGKTHTMLGVDMWRLADEANRDQGALGTSGAPLPSYCAPEHWGLIPRSMSLLFERLSQLDTPAQCWVSYFEIYNEKVYDLLSLNRQGGRRALRIRESKAQGVHVPDAARVPISTLEDVLEILWKGARNRSLSETDMNEHSSRSHTVWQVCVERSTSSEDGLTPISTYDSDTESIDTLGGSANTKNSSVVLSGKLNLVDLAGSEKLNVHRIDGMSQKRINELTSINQSLSCLANCVRALAKGSKNHIPFRNSTLTRLLQEALGGNSRTTFVVTLSPLQEAVDESLSTLQFADRAKRVHVHVKVNRVYPQDDLIRRYEKRIEALEKRLAADSSDGPTRSDGYEEILAQKDALEEQLVLVKEQLVQAESTKNQLLTTIAQTLHTKDTDILGKLMHAIEQEQKQVEDLRQKLEVNTSHYKDRAGNLARCIRGLEKISVGTPSANDTRHSFKQTYLNTIKAFREELSMALRKFTADKEELLQKFAAIQNENLSFATRITELNKSVATHPKLSPTNDKNIILSDTDTADWEHHVDKNTMRSFWYNPRNEQTTWQRPEQIDTEAHKERRRNIAQNLSAFRQSFHDLLPNLIESLRTLISKQVFTVLMAQSGVPESEHQSLWESVKPKLDQAANEGNEQSAPLQETFQQTIMQPFSRELSSFAASIGIR